MRERGFPDILPQIVNIIYWYSYGGTLRFTVCAYTETRHHKAQYTLAREQERHGATGEFLGQSFLQRGSILERRTSAQSTRGHEMSSQRSHRYSAWIKNDASPSERRGYAPAGSPHQTKYAEHVFQDRYPLYHVRRTCRWRGPRSLCIQEKDVLGQANMWGEGGEA